MTEFLSVGSNTWWH